MLLGKIRFYFRKHRILGSSMIRPEAQHGQCLIPGPRPTGAKPCGGSLLHAGEGLPILGILCQIKLSQVNFCHIRHKVPRFVVLRFRLWFRNRGMIMPGFDLGLHLP